MVQLQRRQFDRVVPLFDDNLPNRPMLESVLADRNPGWVFADRAEQPTAAVVVSRYSFTYLGGRPDRELLDVALASSAPADDPVVICSPDEATVPASFMEGGRTIDRIEFRPAPRLRNDLELSPRERSLGEAGAEARVSA